MSSDFFASTLPYIGILGVSAALTLYSAYLAFSVWSGLATPVYRSRALWTAFLALLFSSNIIYQGNVTAIFPTAYGLEASSVFVFLLVPGTVLVLFIWIDRTINILIRLDYLRRDIIGWKRFRILFWALFAVWGLLYNAAQFYPVTAVEFDVPAVILLSYASLVLVLGSRRTKDMTFRLHAKWFGYFIAAFLLGTLAYGTNPIVFALPYALMSYCLYKMARFLVPISRFSDV